MRSVLMKYLNTTSGKPELMPLVATSDPTIPTADLLEKAANRIRSMGAEGTLKEQHIYEVIIRN